MKKLKVALICVLIFFVLLIGIGVVNVDTTQGESQQSTTDFVSLENDVASNINEKTTSAEASAEKEEYTTKEEGITRNETATIEESTIKKGTVTQQDSESEVRVWIPTKGGKKYHSNSDCSGMIEPVKVTISQAKELGFGPCGRCYK